MLLFTNIGGIGHPGREKHSAAVVGRAAVTTFILFRVINVSIALNYILIAFEVLEYLEPIKGTVSVPVAVFAGG